MGVFDTVTKQISSLLGITTAGQKTMAASLPVVLPSDQSSLPVSLGGPYILAQHTIIPDGVAAQVPIPPGASLVWLKADGGTVRIRMGGNPSATLGEQIPDGSGMYINAGNHTGIKAFATGASVKLHMTAYYEYNAFRQVLAYQNFGRWPGFFLPFNFLTEIGNLAWEELAGAWSVNASLVAELNGAVPAGADVANALVVPVGVTTGWFWSQIQMPTLDEAAGLVFRCTNVSEYNSVLCYPDDHSTKPNRIEIINHTGGGDAVLTTINPVVLTHNVIYQISVLVTTNNYAYVFVNDKNVGVVSIGTTHAGTKAGVRETGTTAEFGTFGVCTD